MAVVGITSRSSGNDMKWLMDFIRLELWGYVSDVKYLPITNHNRKEWKAGVRRCLFVILYHSTRQGPMKITDVDEALYDEELQSLFNILSRSKVLVVLDDMEDCSDSERQRILRAQPSLKEWSSQILLFPETGKTEEAYRKKEEFYKLLRHELFNRVEESDRPLLYLLYAGNINRQSITSTKRIYIFSRAPQSNYEWLVKWLKTTYRMRQIDIYGVLITNTSSSFYSELQHCSFAILYHTLKQGRLNITDDTDSLYDEELTHLSRRVGKENVIVVLDDLKNTDSSEKSRILGQQPSIGRRARELFLFDEKEKNPENLGKIKQIISKETPKKPVMGTDNPQTSHGAKSGESSNSATRPDQEHHEDRVDHQPSSSRRGSSIAGGATRRDADDSGELENTNLAQSLRMLNLSDKSGMQSIVKEMLATLQDCQKKMQTGDKKMKEEILKLRREKEELECQNKNLISLLTRLY